METILFYSAACLSASVALAYIIFALVFGIDNTLVKAQVGKYYRFTYLQPTAKMPKIIEGKVLSVRRLSDKSINRIYRESNYRIMDPNFIRTRHLVTIQTLDRKLMNFYAERTSNTKRLPSA